MAGDTYNSAKHDFGVTYDSTVYGLQLAKKEGVPQWSEFDDEYLAQQMFTGAPSTAGLAPEREMSFVRLDRRAGFGEDVFNQTDPKRYYSSVGCDLRHKDMAILSWTMAALTKPSTTAVSITDAGIESWTLDVPDEWAIVGAGTVEDYTVAPLAGSHSALITHADGATTYIHQDVFTSNIQGRRFTVTALCKTNVAAKSQIIISDGVTTFSSAFHNGDNTANTLSITFTASQAATELDIRLSTTGVSGGYWDTVTITRATYGTLTCHADYNSQMYCNLGPLLCKLTGTTLGAVYEFPSTITSLEVFGDGFMYIGLESTTIVENCEDLWVNGAGGTCSVDEGDYKVDSASCKIVNAAGAAGAKIAYENIGPLDLQEFTGLTFWMKASVACAAADMCILLDNTAAVASPEEVIQLPALVAGVWQKIYVRLATPSNCKAILSVGLEYNANNGDNVFHIDDIRAESSYYYMDTGEVLTQSTLAVQKQDSFAKYFRKNGTDCYKVLPPNNLYDTTDPSNTGADNWSTVTTVGRSTTVINSLVSEANVLYVIKETQPWYIVSGAPVLLSDAPEYMTTGAKGKNATHYKGSVIMPYGDASLFTYDTVAATFEWIEPSLYCTNQSAYDGQIQGLAKDAHYLYAIVDNDGAVEVVATREEDINGTARRVWHPLQTQELTGCTYAFASSYPTQTRLYISSTVAAEGVYYMPLPVTYGNIASDVNKAYPTSGTHYFEEPKIDLNFKGDDKTFIKITAELGHANDENIYWECWAKIEDGSYVDVGNLVGDATTRIHTLYYAADTTGRNMRLMFVGITDDAGITPILLWYDVRAILYAAKRKYFVAEVYAADKILGKDGVEMGTTAANVTTYLDAARAATYPVSIRDPWGTTKNVRFLGSRSTPACSISGAFKSKNIEKHYWLMMEEVTLSQ